jgi:tetratricopeptide (TPR) repeat protein
VEEELARWVRTGLARPEAGVLAVSRESLIRLRAEREREAWLEGESPGTGTGRRRIRERAMTHPPLSEARFFLLAAAEDGEAAAREAAGLGKRLEGEGRVEDALGVFEEALALLRRTGSRPEAAEPILVAYLRVATYSATEEMSHRLLYHLGRCGLRTPLIEASETLVRAHARGQDGEMDRSLALLETVPEGLDEDIDFRLWQDRWLAVRLGTMGDREAPAMALRCIRWCRKRGGPRARRLAHSVLSSIRYRQGRYRSSIRHDRRKAALNPVLTARAYDLVSVASSCLEAFDLEAAGSALREAEEILRAHRVPGLESFWEVLRGFHSYRRGREDGPDPDLLAAAGALGSDYHAANLFLQAAAVAWRKGRPEAADLAGRAVLVYRGSRGRWGPEALARALALVAGAVPGPGETAALAEAGSRIQVPGISLQVLGLLGLLRTGVAAPWLERARECSSALDSAHFEVRREVLSAGEALRAVEQDAAGPGNTRGPTEGTGP